MLAFPTPTFDAKGILQAPGYRPLGRGSCLEYQEQPEASTPLNLVNRHTSNGGYVGTRAKTFIQNNQFTPPSYDPTKGTPLSQPGSYGNVGDQAIGTKPKYAEPENGELRAILNVLNGKGTVEEGAGKLSAKQISSLGATSKKLSKQAPERIRNEGSQVVQDYSDAKDAQKKDVMIRKALALGFSKQEAEVAYGKIRIKEAEIALMKEQDPSVRLYDLIDSKISGTQNGSIRGNDETGLFLAQGKNAVMVQKAENRDDMIQGVISKARGRPSDKVLAQEQGLTMETIRANRRVFKVRNGVRPPGDSPL